MGVLRTTVLHAFVFLEVGRLLAAMVAGLGLLHYDKVGTAIKPSYPFVLLPCLLPGRVDGMVPLPSSSSQDTGAVSYNFTAVPTRSPTSKTRKRQVGSGGARA